MDGTGGLRIPLEGLSVCLRTFLSNMQASQKEDGGYEPVGIPLRVQVPN